MVFDYTTLQFLYQFEVHRSVFGKGIQDANIFGGLLLVTNPQRIEAFSTKVAVLGPKGGGTTFFSFLR